MGFTEVLTIIFVVLKILGFVSWSWWLVFLPEIIAFAFYAILIIASLLGFRNTKKKINKAFDDDFFRKF